MEHLPEFFLRQMFHICASLATNAGEFPGKCSKSLNRHFLYNHVKKKSESRQKAIKTLHECKGKNAHYALCAQAGRRAARVTKNGKLVRAYRFLEHLREFFLRQMLLFWPFYGTFAGVINPIYKSRKSWWIRVSSSSSGWKDVPIWLPWRAATT